MYCSRTNTAPQVRLEPATPQSQVKHSTTKLPSPPLEKGYPLKAKKFTKELKVRVCKFSGTDWLVLAN